MYLNPDSLYASSVQMVRHAESGLSYRLQHWSLSTCLDIGGYGAAVSFIAALFSWRTQNLRTRNGGRNAVIQWIPLLLHTYWRPRPLCKLISRERDVAQTPLPPCRRRDFRESYSVLQILEQKVGIYWLQAVEGKASSGPYPCLRNATQISSRSYWNSLGGHSLTT